MSANPVAAGAQEWASKAQALQTQGKYAEAAAAYDKVLEVAPNIAEVHLNKGVVLSAAQRDSEALKCFDRAIELKPELAGAHCNRANILKSSGQAKEAAVSYRAAVKCDPQLQAAWFGLAHVLNEQDLFAEALEAADKAIETAKKVHPPSHNERIFALLKLSRGSEALRDVDVLTTGTPVEQIDGRARKLYALVLSQAAIDLTMAGKHADALGYHERAANADPSYQNLFNFAISQIQNEKQQEAIATLKKARAADANNWKVHTALGTIYMQMQDYKSAVEAFQAAAKFPETREDETVNFNLGVALMNLGNEADAREPLERATRANRDNWTAQALLGAIYIGQNNYKAAETVLQVAVNVASGSADPSVWYNLGYAQLMNNKSDAALASFRRALELDPQSTQAKAAIEALTASPDQVKRSIESGTIAQMDRELAEGAADQPARRHDVADVLDDPLERTKVLIAPQRPFYLRRKSMEGIVLGRVLELAKKFDIQAIKSSTPSNPKQANN